ncbi:4-coumarate--CoA ligase [Gigaspora margarita]|uniref:4-coumarate--CoA ligase n=1 Tax=Gigaspora margarita TaxID=4874 RepID=A0A8H4AW39_GIGMA|nr:4-coumarate--CoA ligase [Gigaspora margarita]
MTAYLIYTSGTTDKLKGIELTHTNKVACLAQLTIAECKLGLHSITMGIAVMRVRYYILIERRMQFKGLGYNEPGGLWIQGPNLFKGYINKKEATVASFTKTDFFTQQMLE